MKLFKVANCNDSIFFFLFFKLIFSIIIWLASRYVHEKNILKEYDIYTEMHQLSAKICLFINCEVFLEFSMESIFSHGIPIYMHFSWDLYGKYIYCCLIVFLKFYSFIFTNYFHSLLSIHVCMYIHFQH